MASIRKLDPKDPKSPWVVEYTDADGKRRRKTPKSGLKKDAEKIRQEVEREIGDGVHTPISTSATVAHVCDEYLKAAELRMRDGRIGRGRYLTRRATVDHAIVPVLGKKEFAALSALDVEGLYNALVKKGQNPRTAKARLYIFKLVEEFARKRGYTKKELHAEAAKELRGIGRAKIRTFTPEEVARIIHVANGSKVGKKSFRGHDMTKCFISLAAFCGLRFGEIAALRRENVRLDDGIIEVRYAATRFGEVKGPKTKAGLRDVPMPEPVVTLLRSWLDKWHLPNDLDLFFSSRRPDSNQTYISQGNFYSRCWIPVLKQAGLHSPEGNHFHALRHFAASWMIASGFPITDVAKILGHEKFDVTLQTYAHPMMNRNRQHEAMERMAAGLLSLGARPVIDATETRLMALSC